MTYPPLAAGLFGYTKRTPMIVEIQASVERKFGVAHREMLSPCRYRGIARPRQIAMSLACSLTPRSYAEIGRMFGNRDHTTVIWAKRRIEELRAVDPELDADVRALERELSV